MILALVPIVLAATPVDLATVRTLSRENVEALRAELEQRRAAEQVSISRSTILPHLTLESGATTIYQGQQRYFEPGTTEVIDVPAVQRGNFSLSVTLAQLLYDGGRWWNLISQSGAAAEAALGQAREQRLAAELEGVRRFYELYRAQRVLAVLEATLRQSEAQLDRARALFEAGRAQKREAIAAEVNVGNDRIFVLRQQSRIANAQADLAVWISRSGADELVASDPGILQQAPQPGPALAQALKLAREQRPLYRALDQQVRASELGVSVARAAYQPRLSGFVQYGRQSPAAEHFVDPNRQNVVSAGLVLNWDLFSGLSSVAQVQQAQIAQRLAELNRDQAAREIEAEVRKALAVLGSQLLVTEVAVANRALAQKGLVLAEDRFTAGAGSTLDVRDAQLKLTQAELSLVESRIAVEIARAAVERVTGAQP